MAAAQPVPAFSYASGTICAKLSRGERTLLQDVSFSLSAGERLAIIGETGSGKTLRAVGRRERHVALPHRHGAVYAAKL